VSEQQQSADEKVQFAAYVGIDWADTDHVWSLQVATTGKREHGDVGHSPEAVEEWINGLMARFPGQQVAVALEQSRGALLNMLSKYQQLVLFPVHPATISRLRAALYPSGAKDDPKDADLVLDVLVYHRERLRPLEPDTVETRELRFLVEQRRSFVDQKTAQSNRLKSVLKQYYPQILSWFDDPAAPLVAAFLSRWPTIEMLQKARPETLVNFFHEHNCRSQKLINERLEQIRKAVPATRDQAVLESSIVLTHWVCKIIALLGQSIADLDERIRPLAKAHTDYSIFDSLPGAGEVMVPRLIAAFGTKRDRFSNASQVQSFSGIAPVKETAATASGSTCAGLARSSSGRPSTNGPATPSHSPNGPVLITDSSSPRGTATMLQSAPWPPSGSESYTDAGSTVRLTTSGSTSTPCGGTARPWCR
jgi:hypothetical protein